jgi:hypothetical protein
MSMDLNLEKPVLETTREGLRKIFLAAYFLHLPLVGISENLRVLRI